MNLFDEAWALLSELRRNDVQYAIAGALALAIHGVPRATTDIDLLIPPEALDAAVAAAHACGFALEAIPMRFSDGMEVQRIVKIAGEETLTLDLLMVDDNLAVVWNDRQKIGTDQEAVWVVSRQGLISMKTWAGRDQDLADIRRLTELDR